MLAQLRQIRHEQRSNANEIQDLLERERKLLWEVEKLRLHLSATLEEKKLWEEKYSALQHTLANRELDVVRLQGMVNRLAGQLHTTWKPLLPKSHLPPKYGLDVGTSPLPHVHPATPVHRGRTPARGHTPARTLVPAHSPMRTPAPPTQHVISPPHAALPPRTPSPGTPLQPDIPSTLPSTTDLYVGDVVHMYANTWSLGGKTYRALRECPTFRGPQQYQVFSRIKHAYEIYLVLTERGISDPVECMHQFLLEKKLGEKLYRLKKDKLSLEQIATLMTTPLVSF